ncbi:hypothetical protein [Mucilaginibacter sp. UR6-11]|uniref:hypothetical protein n=1 Tax=Mucilaginibacter sp. UR6-11 TaxID=1435644 RepID=UPI001E388483|nr:hypothetical protein [Mucilaginibacter sp. UR6-11]MCC8425862.1 hypothetical protein [Mucilaginibacter sp. UR6-11]
MHTFYINFLRLGIISIVILISFAKSAIAQQLPYPKTVGYFSIANPLATLANGKIGGNFSGAYTINFPFGLNLLKSDRFGVSFEISPSIRTEKNIAKVSSVAFSPGGIFRFQHNFAIVQRVAFETSGRFGFTTIFNKILVKGKDASPFVAIPFATRFGNNTGTSLTTALQLGIFF